MLFYVVTGSNKYMHFKGYISAWAQVPKRALQHSGASAIFNTPFGRPKKHPASQQMPDRNFE
jgi:hypothetical protein